MLQLNENQIFQYNGSPITFQKGDSVMVNATQMAKSFGKEPKFWLMNQSTTDYLNELSKVRNLTLTDLVQVTKGGNNPGTWMHEDVALEFARWLSPAFAIWCNDRIKELLQYGMTATQPTLEQMINNPDLVISLATQLKSEREEKKRLALEVQKKEQEKQSIIEETKPAVVFKECFTSSSTNILIGDLAKLITQNGYKIGEIRLYEWMVENKFLIRRQRYSRSKNKYINDYMPTQRAAEMGLFFVKERPIVSGENPIFIKHTCYVTGKGQVYFLNKFKSLMAA